MLDPTLGDIRRLRRLFEKFAVGRQGEADQVAGRYLLLKSTGRLGSSIDWMLRRTGTGCRPVPSAAELFAAASLVG